MTTIALSTGSLYTYGLTRAFELAAAAGFDAVEVLVDHRWDSRQPAYLQRLMDDTGLPVAAVHSPFVPHAPGWPDDPLGRLHETATLARALGAPVVVTHLPFRFCAVRVELLGLPGSPRILPLPLPLLRRGNYRPFLLDGLAEFEADRGLLVGVENMPARPFLGRRLNIYALNDLETLVTLPHLTLDTTHLGTWGLDPLAVYERLKERVVHVHLSNFDGREHRLPQDGHLPLGELLQRLARDGYQGAVTVEVGPEVLEAEDESQVRAHLEQVVDFCRLHTNHGQDPFLER
jgi:sugar phosphate isomerase/epimerase